MNVLITGGAGFIGANAAQRYLERGDSVTVVDDLTRPSAEKNPVWLDGRGDQRVYFSDIRKAAADFGWSPKISKVEGLERLYDWVAANKELFT